MCASLEAFSFLSLFHFNLVLAHSSCESWTTGGCDAVLAAIYCCGAHCVYYTLFGVTVTTFQI